MMDLKTALTVIILALPFFAMTVWAVVDVARKDFTSIGEKAFWGLIAAIPFVGFFIYLLFGFRRGAKPAGSSRRQNNV